MKQRKKYIKPVLRYYGSKYRMLDKIFDLLDLQPNDNFLDMFGGSGIVGVNAKYLYSCEVTINDIDNNFPLSKNKVIENQCRFNGKGGFSESAIRRMIKKINQGFWDTYNIYKDISNKIHISHINWWTTIYQLDPTFFNKIYVDPPYYGIKSLYKEDLREYYMHVKLFKILEKFKSYSKIVISYNDCPQIKELYKDWKIIEIDVPYQTGLNNENKKRIGKELLITNETN